MWAWNPTFDESCQQCKDKCSVLCGERIKTLLETEVPKLYPGELEKVIVHHDKASSHTAKRTANYSANLKQRLGITIIPNSEIPVKSPDLSPMDFFGFGLLKQRLFKRRVRSLDGLWKVLKEEWSKIPPKTIDNVMRVWKNRLSLVRKTNGLHVEPVSKTHYRKIK